MVEKTVMVRGQYGALPAGTASGRLPPLQSGDRLTLYEFERRYRAMPHLKKAELIEGVVYMPSPVSVDHSEAHGYMMGWLATYTAATPGVKLNDNSTVRLDLDNEVQPDALLRVDSTLGGSCQIGPDRYLEGPPELIVEIAVSSAAYDLHDKRNVYRRNGVQEYVVWQIYEERIDWFRLSDEGEYVFLEVDSAGLIHSRVFPGLNLKVKAMLDGDLGSVLAEVRRGVETEAYKRFVEKLSQKRDEMAGRDQ